MSEKDANYAADRLEVWARAAVDIEARRILHGGEGLPRLEPAVVLQVALDVLAVLAQRAVLEHR